jgi:TM2 domain-containing membrane protein YozV
LPARNVARDLAVGRDDAGERLRCPNCNAEFNAPGPLKARRVSSVPDDGGQRIACGVVAIIIGGFGIHKFMLGLTNPGLVMLLVTVLTCGFGGIVMHAIAIAEGIIYLTMSDEAFYEKYVVEKKGWF